MILMFIGINTYRVFFLKCSEKTSYPIFHDPRPGAEMTKLFMKNQEQITLGSNQIHYKPKPGTMIIFQVMFHINLQ